MGPSPMRSEPTPECKAGTTLQSFSRVSASSEPVWSQVYAASGRAGDDAARAVAAGCKALCVTIGVSPDGAPIATNWDAVQQLTQAVNVPVVVKGIMSVGDARTALERGADGLVVSNHGGRAIDYGPSTLEVLEEVVDAVDGRVPVLIDSGFRRGADVLKAVALGADAVLVGRPFAWGLACAGEQGVAEVLRRLLADIDLTLALTGHDRIDGLTRAALASTRY